VNLLGNMRVSFWLFALGAIVLYVFFFSLATIPPTQVAGVTMVIALLAVLVAIHNVRVNSELADPGGDPRLRRSLNRQREHRGF
jgi:cytochrome bd-type quinol oxidase subunit 1